MRAPAIITQKEYATDPEIQPVRISSIPEPNGPTFLDNIRQNRQM